MHDGIQFDYSRSGLSICAAMITDKENDPAKRTTPRKIRWGRFEIQTSDQVIAPLRGVVRAEFISVKPGLRQGFDLKVDGWFELLDGSKVPVLRTWTDERFEDIVEYPYSSRDGRLHVWNVYEMLYPDGSKVEEKWTENAGFWVEVLGSNKRIYHCSQGSADPPDFESLVFKVSAKSNPGRGDKPLID
jgi:hypothetical protein